MFEIVFQDIYLTPKMGIICRVVITVLHEIGLSSFDNLMPHLNPYFIEHFSLSGLLSLMCGLRIFYASLLGASHVSRNEERN